MVLCQLFDEPHQFHESQVKYESFSLSLMQLSSWQIVPLTRVPCVYSGPNDTSLIRFLLLFVILFSSAYNANTARQRAPYIMDHPEDVTVQKHSPTTLNCKADGNPPPVIEWFKDGEKVKHTGNRMVLPSGSLFFLHVIQNKDTGVYWCTAINNLGSVASRKATLSCK